MNKKTFVDVMSFWRDVEALSPQDIPKSSPSDPHEPTRDCAGDTPLPWLDSGFKQREIPASKAWRHSVYAAIYQRSQFIDLLAERIGKQPNVFEERLTGLSSVFFLAFDERGRPLLETFVISMAAWAYGIVETESLAALHKGNACDPDCLKVPSVELDLPPSNTGLLGFDAQQDGLRKELAWRLGNLPDGKPVDGLWLADFAELVIDKCKVRNLVGRELKHRIQSLQVNRPKDKEATVHSKSQDDFLNSFVIKDLNRVIAAGFPEAGIGLKRFLEPPTNIERIDVRKEKERALDFLNPECFPEGCWPAKRPLVWSQQLAVNSIWQHLRAANGIFAVNGPPGTGKTTLLRDVVAAVVVERAKVLAEHGSRLLGLKQSMTVGNRTIPYYTMDPALAGFSIVVASSNNGAVENVSLELPRDEAIDSTWKGRVKFYGDLASDLLGQTAWAMISARLGKKDNRSKFVDTFWWQGGEDGKKTAGLRERLHAISQRTANPVVPWELAVNDFSKALSVERVFRRRLAALKKLPDLMGARPRLWKSLFSLGIAHWTWRADVRHALAELKTPNMNVTMKCMRAKIDDVEVELTKSRALLGSDWPDLSASDEDQERSSPWTHEDWRRSRIEVFVAALNLHRAFIEENARKMMANLGVMMDVIRGGIPDPKVRSIGLESLAIACPVISTTFASASNLFGELGPESIGWLLIDEAGQATPQHAAGSIWRARRVVAVGDPMQLEPIVTLPSIVQASLAKCNGNIGSYWHPTQTSVQRLADQATPIGTFVGKDGEAIWVGAPLRVHRRCDNPMFAISNTIAYDGMMVHQKTPSPRATKWPRSEWIDVKKASNEGNWLPAEGDAVADLLGRLSNCGVPSGDIFLISPFRDVARQLLRLSQDYRLNPERVGTVHTTQGKQANVVILVLGGGTVGARDWAASKPNLLNVAVTRAESRLYVIGDRVDWRGRRFFDVLSRELN
jgi:hypothetical protein